MMGTRNHSHKCLGCETPAVCPGDICDERVYVPLLLNSFFDGPHIQEDFFSLRVKDDTMEPTLRVGDVVIAKKINRVVADSLYVVEMAGVTKVKRLQIRANGKVLVICDHESYGNFEIDEGDDPEVKILGFVFWTFAVRGYAGIQLPG